MDSRRWQELEPILDQALDLPPEEREPFLDEACGDDDALRKEVRQWLLECEASGSFLQEAGGEYLERVVEASPFDPTALARVGSRLGAFRLLSVLGQGGMGTVFLAERADGQFEQQVAVKVVHRQGLGEGVRERFRFERQILARLEHPNIARLLDGGVDGEGVPFLVMEYVDGVPLDEYCDARKLDLGERLRLVADVCRAVSYAHRRQVVHRDLKPSNVLVHRAGEVKLLDFGVAELLDGPARESSRIGSGYRLTLGFAAPEVLRGETATSSSDLYSLGVLLFQIVTGALPFPVGDLSLEELVERVSTEEPPQPSRRVQGGRRPSGLTLRELDAIVLQALAKDPSDRPSSAEALADDLLRLVDGEPVQALPQSLPYLLRKRFDRHRWLWISAAAAGLLLLFFAGGWLRSKRQAEQRTEVAHSFAQEAERIEWFLRYAQSLPLHDIRRERDLMERRLARLEVQIAGLGDLAVGPGQFALGRGYAQLGENRRALEALETAWESGFRTPGAALALGKVLGKLYDQNLKEVLRLKDPALREDRRRELESRYRDRALDFLRQSGSSELESPNYLAGLIAFYDGRHGDAIERAALAQEEAPWLPEGYLLEGDAALALAITLGEKGEYQEAEGRFSQAQEAYRRAQEMAPSDPVPYESSCEAWTHTIDVNRLRGADLGESYDLGRRACEHALKVQPDRPSCLLKIALISIFRLQDPRLGPGELGPLLDEALRTARAAEALAPGHGEVHQTLGTAYLSKAMLVEMRQGGDPRQDLELAAAAYRRAIHRDPGLLTSHTNLGTVLAISGGLLMNQGEDPRPDFDEAIESYRQALSRGPGRVALFNNLGNLHWNKSTFLIRRGLDPSDSLEGALQACRDALAINPRMVPALNLRGALEETLGKLAADRGEDPGPYFARSLESLAATLEEHPRYFPAAVNLGSAHLSRARRLAVEGSDPSTALAAASRALEKALELGPPGDAEIAFNRVDVLYVQAELAAADGVSPEPYLREARHVLLQALQERPDNPLLLAAQAEGELLRGDLLSEDRWKDGICLAEAREKVEGWLQRDPRDVRGLLLKARLHATCASWEATPGDRRREIATGLTALGEVPEDPPLYGRERRLLLEALRLLGPSDDGARGEASRRRLQELMGKDPIAGRRWGHLLKEPGRAPA